MEILSRFVVGDGENAYVVNDGVTYTSLERGLYESTTLEGLKESGYKILGYYGNILTPEGVLIRDFKEELYAVTDDELQIMNDIADAALTEDEAAEYFDRDVEISYHSFKEPDVEIGTREELLKYLDDVQAHMGYSVYRDVRPLNSFVAREALFTMSEILTNEKLRCYFMAIERRRRITTRDEYHELVRYLQGKGVLGEDFTPDDLVDAYLSWGICGIQTPCVQVRKRERVLTSIASANETADEAARNYYRAKEICLLDRNMMLYYSGGTADMSDLEDETIAPVLPLDKNKFKQVTNTRRSWKHKYEPLVCACLKPETRWQFELLDESAVRYDVRISQSEIAIFMCKNLRMSIPFITARGLDGSIFWMEKCTDGEYGKWNLLMAKARQMVADRTVDPPVKNSWELFMQEGLTPYSAIKYAGIRVEQNLDLNPDYSKDVPYGRAAEYYRDEIDADLIREFTPEDCEYNSKDELISIMCNTRDDKIEKGEYLVLTDGRRPSIAEAKMFQNRPIECLEFASLLKKGDISVDSLNEGFKADGKAETAVLARFLNTLLDVEYKGVPTETALMQLESDSYVDFSQVVRQRSNAYLGYLIDRARLNKVRIEEACSFVYVTRVFREMANVPISQQRDYAFVGISAELTGKRQTVADLVYDSLCESIDEAIKPRKPAIAKDLWEVLQMSIPAIAVNIMFGLHMGSMKLQTGSMGTYVEVAAPEGLGEMLIIQIKDAVLDQYTRYGFGVIQSDNSFRSAFPLRFSTLSDYCEAEWSANGACSYYCVNANINPWYVDPKKGYSIPAYNFYINYESNQNLQSVANEKFLTTVAEKKAKWVWELCFVKPSMCLVPGLPLRSTDIQGIMLRSLLDPLQEETVQEYCRRFFFEKAEAAKEGKIVKHIPLRSDIVYADYADAYGVEPVTEPEVAKEEYQGEGFLYVRALDVEVLESERSRLQIAGGNRVRLFKWSEERYEDILRWTELVSGTFKPQGACLVAGDLLITKSAHGEGRYAISEMTETDCRTLVDAGLFYQLGARSYLIPTVRGDMKLEVM